jgi:uncharacterized protein YgbK (DUF1537 family)
MDMRLILGAVADDFTGATDLAGMLAASGMRTMLVLGLPEPEGDCWSGNDHRHRPIPHRLGAA